MTLVLLTPLVTQAKTVSKGHKTTTAARTTQLKKKSKKKSKNSRKSSRRSQRNPTDPKNTRQQKYNPTFTKTN